MSRFFYFGLILLGIILLVPRLSYSQDIITKKSGEEILAKVLEVGISEVKFKKTENLNGPIYFLLRSDLLLIRYENGSKDFFTEASQVESKLDLGQNMSYQGQKDAQAFYRGKKTGAAWVGITSLVATPIIGAIPAIVCATTIPEDQNLHFPDEKLMKNNSYSEAYNKQALKTKRTKVIKGYTFGSLVWVFIFLIL